MKMSERIKMKKDFALLRFNIFNIEKITKEK